MACHRKFMYVMCVKNHYCYINNDLIEGSSAFCQPKETLMTDVLP